MEVTALDRETRRSWRPVALMIIAPLTVVGGVVWAVAQPYRVTLLDARGHGFWDLLAQPPLLVVAVALIFHAAVAMPLARELDGR